MKKNKKSLKKTSILGATVLVGASFLAPLNANAETGTASVKASIHGSLSMILSKNDLHLDLDDTNLHTDSLMVTASTNSIAGYTISFNANNNYDYLKHSNSSIHNTIGTIFQDETEATFPETGWGYSTDTENYTFSRIKTTQQNIFSTVTTGQNNHEFTIGMRAGADMPAGDYENELLFTAVANPIPAADSISTITNMQEMTPEVCAASALNETKQLVDTRDNKTYWVTKLADENCWMTQNLDLDLSSATALTPEDSDVASNWTPSVSTNSGAWTYEQMDSQVAYSYDPGNYYFDGTYSVATYEDGCDYTTEACAHFATTPYALNGEHGHVGNYYNAYAATASTDGTIGIKDSSICPKGWRLPNPTGNKSMIELFHKYDLATSYSGLKNEVPESDTDEQLLATPFYLVRGGSTNNGTDLGRNHYPSAGWSGLYHTTQLLTSTEAAATAISSEYIAENYPSSQYGYSIRCVSR